MGAGAGLDDPGDGDQGRVALPVSEAVVVRLEMVHVDRHEGQRALVAVGALDLGVEGRPEEAVVREARQRVALGARLDLLEAAGVGQGDDGVAGDPIDRDDSFHVRMYDVVTDEMVYEIALYHHYKNGEAAKAQAQTGKDACGVKFDDEIGAYGDPGDGGITDSESFDQWFSDSLGTNESAGHTVSLQRDDDGVYEYMTNDFYPIDDRLMGNEGDNHNNFFTYTFSASFTYDECTSQFFEFASNDDAWVYIDNSLVIDLGGTATTQKQYVDLDRLGLVDGNVYTLNFFFAHRRDTIDSLFHMRTNIQLNTGELPSIAGFFD